MFVQMIIQMLSALEVAVAKVLRNGSVSIVLMEGIARMVGELIF